jgi:hypothetical protein
MTRTQYECFQQQVALPERRRGGGCFRQDDEQVSTAPVSHQKRPEQTATNTIENKRKHSKIIEVDRYSAAHNGLVSC